MNSIEHVQVLRGIKSERIVLGVSGEERRK